MIYGLLCLDFFTQHVFKVHVVACYQYFTPFYCQVIFHFFTHLSVDGHLGYFYFQLICLSLYPHFVSLPHHSALQRGTVSALHQYQPLSSRAFALVHTVAYNHPFPRSVHLLSQLLIVLRTLVQIYFFRDAFPRLYQIPLLYALIASAFFPSQYST